MNQNDVVTHLARRPFSLDDGEAELNGTGFALFENERAIAPLPHRTRQDRAITSSVDRVLAATGGSGCETGGPGTPF